MRDILLIIQIVTSIALIASILVQVRGPGFGRAWGSSGSSFTRRGLEKLIFKLTFVLCGIFALVAILQFVL